MVALVAGALGAAAGPADASITLARGELVDAGGAPTDGTVRAYIFPTHDGRQALRMAARVRPGADGRFVLTTSQVGRLARAGMGRDGWVDIMVDAETARATGSSFLSVRVDRRPGGAVATTSTTTRRLRVQVDEAKPWANAAGGPASGGYPCGGNPAQIVTRKVDSFKQATIVGELNNAYRDTVAKFRYGQSADTDFSVAVAPAGEGFELEGENHVGTQDRAEIGRSRRGPYARKILSNFRFGKYRVVRSTGRARPGCNPNQLLRTVLKADEWTGGLYDRRQRRTIRVCPGGSEAYSGQDHFERDSLDAVTWTFGVRVLGVGLKTKSGFSRFVQTRFDFGGPRSRRHALCGSRGRPATRAGRIYSGFRRGAAAQAVSGGLDG